ncbi:hypothetical protein GH714_036620 [Hevea brasiliensis]|uniref:Uncharacterized protein n=1 Tax=Hevea brasiliensis TaxID=3981 RepID=A0A6A6LSC8_HEVBR|nr:hypothetical protein GH714_036620 [Hevea brasiliensis]
MAFLQMKRVVSEVLGRYKVVPAAEDGEEPVFISHVTSKMKGGLPVRFEERIIKPYELYRSWKKFVAGASGSERRSGSSNCDERKPQNRRCDSEGRDDGDYGLPL